jgi:HTH-type transcriptional regulator/antitoxin HigA
VEIGSIQNRREYRAALKEAERLMDAAEGSADEDKLDLLVDLIESYERVHFPLTPPGSEHTGRKSVRSGAVPSAPIGKNKHLRGLA